MTEGSTRVLVISNDLFFMPQIEGAAKAAGFTFEWIDTPVSDEEFVARLAAAPTTLVVLELATRLPWQQWLPAAKAHEALAGIQWLAFGPHTDAKLLGAARKAGVHKVVARSKFAEALREMLASVHPQHNA